MLAVCKAGGQRWAGQLEGAENQVSEGQSLVRHTHVLSAMGGGRRYAASLSPRWEPEQFASQTLLKSDRVWGSLGTAVTWLVDARADLSPRSMQRLQCRLSHRIFWLEAALM